MLYHETFLQELNEWFEGNGYDEEQTELRWSKQYSKTKW